MTKSPYKPTPGSQAGPQRPVSRYSASSATAFAIALFVALPGIFLLYTDTSSRMASGRRYATYDREFFIFGHPVSPEAFIAWSLGISTAFLVLSIAMLFVALRNRRLNRNGAE